MQVSDANALGRNVHRHAIIRPVCCAPHGGMEGRSRAAAAAHLGGDALELNAPRRGLGAGRLDVFLIQVYDLFLEDFVVRDILHRFMEIRAVPV